MMRSLWSKLPLLLLILYVGVLLYGTLAPFRFTLHPRRDTHPGRGIEWVPFTRLCPKYGIFCPQDTGLNVAMLIPVGMLVAFIPRESAKSMRRILLGTGVGFLMSLSIETTQYFVPARIPGVTDLLLNTLGACLGAIAVAFVVGRKRASGPLLVVRGS